MKRNLYKSLIFTAAAFVGVTTSCTSDIADDQKDIDPEIFDPNSSLNTVFDGKLFSIPSPVQTALLIKELELEFDESLLNDDSSVTEYVSEYQQALNLGIYGTDLGYSTLYDQKGVTMSYLGAVEKLTASLGLDGAFNTDLLNRFEKNNSDQDSMVQIMSDAFREADNFLKKSNRKATSALVLTGGWIESLHFACALQSQKPSEKMLNRIGEQKQSLNSILGILEAYNKGGSNDDLIVELKDLQVIFDDVVLDYNYEAPDTDEKNHITTLHHSLDVIISTEIMEMIKSKINEIRSNIIKA